jgi:hypothetical protein
MISFSQSGMGIILAVAGFQQACTVWPVASSSLV